MPGDFLEGLRGQGPCLRSRLPAVNPGLCTSDKALSTLCLSLPIGEMKMVILSASQGSCHSVVGG